MKFQIGSVSVDMIEANDRVCGYIRDGKTFEPRTLEIWASLCATRGNTVLDVGAYCGLFSISAALHKCKVVAFEPMPFNAARIAENAERNGCRAYIQIVEAAVSDSPGKSHITYSPNVKGFTAGASLVRKKGVRLPIPLVTIDMMDLHNVSAIKIDVERGEPAVLRGARATIERCKPALLVEVLDDERKAQVRAALPDYQVTEEIDARNWLMMPC